MALTKYNFLDDSFSNNYLVYTPVVVDFPLSDGPLDVSNMFSEILPSGNPVVRTTEVELTTTQRQNPRLTIDNTRESSITYNRNTSNDDDISFEDLLKLEGVHAKITSGYRENAKTSSGKPSHHATKGGAYDIVPLDGDFEKLRKEIYGNPRIIAWMKNKGWGILEETNPTIKKRTGATGDHWHFGPDKIAVEQFNLNLA